MALMATRNVYEGKGDIWEDLTPVRGDGRVVRWLRKWAGRKARRARDGQACREWDEP